MRSHALLLLVATSTAFVPPFIKHRSGKNGINLPNRPTLLSPISFRSSRRPSNGDGGKRRPRPDRIPPSNPEELDAARRGEWNYDKGIIEKKEEEEVDELEY